MDSQQFVMRVIDVEALLPADHRARAIRELTGRRPARAAFAGLRSSRSI